jgi:hypothetical protein
MAYGADVPGDSGGGAAPRAGAEASRLLSAAQQWLRESAPHLAPLDAAGEPCSCPLCRAVAAVRDADPDSVGRWVDSAVSALEQTTRQVAAQAQARAEAARASSGTDGATWPTDGEDAVVDEPSGAQPGDAGPPRVRRIPLDDGADGG